MHHWLLFEATEFWGALLPNNKYLLDLHLFLGGAIFTLSRLEGEAGERHLVFSKRIPYVRKSCLKKTSWGFSNCGKGRKAQGGLCGCILTNSRTRSRSSFRVMDNP